LVGRSGAPRLRQLAGRYPMAVAGLLAFDLTSEVGCPSFTPHLPNVGAVCPAAYWDMTIGVPHERK
jgi:hypothetical protein